MNKPIRVLVLEDKATDAEVLIREVKRAGFAPEWRRVETEADFLSELANAPELILSDYSLPHFDGLQALALLRQRGLDTPFILVSGTLGEETAVEAMNLGADDYLLKDRTARLGPAIQRVLERNRLRAQFIEAQKMEVVGQLAGGVAHDFNNILAVIMGYSDLMIPKLDPEHEFKSYVETIRSSAERAAGLTRQLLIFSRKQQVELVVLDLNEVLIDTKKMLLRLIDEHIELTVVPAKEIGRIKADSGYVGQVIMNLVVNARDAMPKGGKLTISTANARLDENFTRAHEGAVPGDYVKLSVNDTGTGMTDEVRSRIFEAFFTTKPAGKGTGLGLATCHTIVQQSGGYIDVQTAVGQGTTFDVYFPRVHQPLEKSTEFLMKNPPQRGTETLLVVEDDPALRHLARSVLEGQGYQVLSASNGQEGLHTVRDHKGSPIRLVITDVVMPIMGGKVMAEWLTTSDPGLKILFTSGYMEDSVSVQGSLQKAVEFLSKPYAPATLCRKVREMLDN